MKLEYMLGAADEKPLENLVNNGGYTAIFRRIGVVGDSLSSGEFESKDKDGNKGYHDYFEYSWGQNLARISGSECINFSRGGMTAKEYCESFGDSMRFWDSRLACQCYIIALGVNDIHNMGQEIGSIDDIKEDYTQNGESFIGYYAQIIQRLKKIQPKAKFFLMTMPKEESRRIQEKTVAHRKAIYEIAEYFDNTYVLDIYEYGPVYDDEFKKRFYMGGHMNPMGYVFTAHMVASYIDYIIRHNINDFKEVGFIGTDLNYTE
ncbi:MAG: SGNH/GDSL hydrolase family protein [Clostridia bacterium]|nr:SGNH/GDSL hydrolase family protein [Clostridia bacterium]